jgi:hypothetical protein
LITETSLLVGLCLLRLLSFIFEFIGFVTGLIIVRLESMWQLFLMLSLRILKMLFTTLALLAHYSQLTTHSLASSIQIVGTNLLAQVLV